MSQQRAPTLDDVELRYHDSKTNTDALVATLLREYKGKFAQIAQQVQLLKTENQKLNADLAKFKHPEKPKKEGKPKPARPNETE